MMEMIKVVMITQLAMIYATASKKEVRNFLFFKFCTSSNVNNILYFMKSINQIHFANEQSGTLEDVSTFS